MIGQLTEALVDVDDLAGLSADQQTHVLALNDQLHVLMVGEDNARAANRVCRTEVPIGSNIRRTTCRTRAQIAGARQASRDLLDERMRDLERDAFQRSQERSIDGSGGIPSTPAGSAPLPL